MKRIAIPEEFTGDDSIVFVVNVSGGKDSAAAALAMVEAKIPHRRVFVDTAWEAAETYAHLDVLRSKLGPIDVVGYPGGMPAKIREGARFASRMQRWCTRELKIEPLRAYYDSIEKDGATAVCVTGIRSEEGTPSNGRAEMPEVQDDEAWGGWMWRPIRTWTIADVIDIHHRHGLPLNPLYLRGHDRVGCYPCVMASKEDIRLVAEHAPDRIALIRELESGATAERARRNEVEPGRYKSPDATFFLTVQRARGGAMRIDDVVAWSKTERGGGRYVPLFPKVPDGGCFRWGLCEAPEPVTPEGHRNADGAAVSDAKQWRRRESNPAARRGRLLGSLTFPAEIVRGRAEAARSDPGRFCCLRVGRWHQRDTKWRRRSAPRSRPWDR